MRKCGYQSHVPKRPVFLFLNSAEIIPFSSVFVWPAGFFIKIFQGNFYQNTKLSTFAFSTVFCYSELMEEQKMKHENPETKLIREQNQYIRVLEEQLYVCKRQIKAQEVLIEKQNQALALFADAFSKEEK